MRSDRAFPSSDGGRPPLACGLALALLLLGGLLADTPARAQTPPGGPSIQQPWKELIARGNALYQLDNFTEALALYEKAHLLRPSPTTLHNIAQCHRGLKNYARAIKSFQAYLEAAPTAANRADVESLMVELGQLLAGERLSEQARPSTVMVDDPTTEPRASAPVVSATPAAPLSVLPSARTASTTSEELAPPIYKRWWFWTLIGVVVTGAAVGVGVGVSRCPAHAVCP